MEIMVAHDGLYTLGHGWPFPRPRKDPHMPLPPRLATARDVIALVALALILACVWRVLDRDSRPPGPTPIRSGRGNDLPPSAEFLFLP